jgi:hypothetical protein
MTRKSAIKGAHHRSTKKPSIATAIPESVARRRRTRLLDLIGKLEWDTTYDYKAERTRD